MKTIILSLLLIGVVCSSNLGQNKAWTNISYSKPLEDINSNKNKLKFKDTPKDNGHSFKPTSNFDMTKEENLDIALKED